MQDAASRRILRRRRGLLRLAGLLLLVVALLVPKTTAFLVVGAVAFSIWITAHFILSSLEMAAQASVEDDQTI